MKRGTGISTSLLGISSITATEAVLHITGYSLARRHSSVQEDYLKGFGDFSTFFRVWHEYEREKKTHLLCSQGFTEKHE